MLTKSKKKSKYRIDGEYAQRLYTMNDVIKSPHREPNTTTANTAYTEEDGWWWNGMG
jgi:hypothetical protein